MELATVYQRYFESLRGGDRRAALATARDALDNGIDIRDLYMEVLQPAMYAVGHLWETNQFTVAQEHLATAITQSVMAQIYATVVSRPPIGRTMIATCIGSELHELGIRMVTDFFEMEGWEVVYLGANMPPEGVISMLESKQIDLLAISVTLGSHVLDVRSLIGAIRAHPASKHVKILVGGQPFNRAPDIYRMIGADFMAINAREAVQAAMGVLV
jgi:methanogenic corrinoid protein MtbC1